jgi:hypothetical protein
MNAWAVKVASRFAPPALLPSQSLDSNVRFERVGVENDGENQFLHRFFWINPNPLKNYAVQHFDNLADVIYDDSQ